MCGGFTCSRNALIALNILYILVGFLLIGVGVYGRAASVVTNLPIIGGILGCGIILILISILGLAGAIKHHQVMLFFYMIILFILFLVQFSIACSCLAVNSKQQKEFAEEGWTHVPDSIKKEVQDTFFCCGLKSNQTTITISTESTTMTTLTIEGPSCDIINRVCCSQLSYEQKCTCPPCLPKLEDKINYAFKLCGGIGLFFSFTEVLAVFLTRHYRNQQDPYYLPPRAVFPRSNYQY